jgi:hypothetical protein
MVVDPSDEWSKKNSAVRGSAASYRKPLCRRIQRELLALSTSANVFASQLLFPGAVAFLWFPVFLISNFCGRTLPNASVS